MPLPSSYLTSTKNLPAILEAIKNAQAPQRFTMKFLEGIGYPSSADRLVINVLKALGFLTDTGEPTKRYHEFLDKSQSGRVLAQGLREAYSELFQIHRNAPNMSRDEVRGKMKTLSQGQYSDDVLGKMATTFKTLAGQADFSTAAASAPELEMAEPGDPNGQSAAPAADLPASRTTNIGGLVYSINIHLPESRDPAVYDALFRSLKEHLL